MFIVSHLEPKAFQTTDVTILLPSFLSHLTTDPTTSNIIEP